MNQPSSAYQCSIFRTVHQTFLSLYFLQIQTTLCIFQKKTLPKLLQNGGTVYQYLQKSELKTITYTYVNGQVKSNRLILNVLHIAKQMEYTATRGQKSLLAWRLSYIFIYYKTILGFPL